MTMSIYKGSYRHIKINSQFLGIGNQDGRITSRERTGKKKDGLDLIFEKKNSQLGFRVEKKDRVLCIG